MRNFTTNFEKNNFSIKSTHISVNEDEQTLNTYQILTVDSSDCFATSMLNRYNKLTCYCDCNANEFFIQFYTWIPNYGWKIVASNDEIGPYEEINAIDCYFKRGEDGNYETTEQFDKVVNDFLIRIKHIF